MALRKLVDGQCGEGNALMKMTQHVSKDLSHRQGGLKRSQNRPPSSSEEVLSQDLFVNQFLENALQPMSAAPQSFRMDTLLQEMNDIEGIGHKSSPAMGPNVAHLARQPETWVQEYLDSNSHIKDVEARSNHTPILQNMHHTLPYNNYPTMPSYIMTSRPLPSLPQKTSSDSELSAAANRLLSSVDDPKLTDTEFMKYVQDLAGRNNEDGTLWTNSFLGLNADQSFATSNLGKSDSQDIDAPDFLDEVNIDSEKMTSSERENFWSELQNKWKRDTDDDSLPWGQDTDFVTKDKFENYKFQENNPLKDHPDPLTEGKRLLKMGLLPFAILHFEAACQQKPDSVEAWKLLGQTHAENEQDESAIAAIKQCLLLDENNLEAWMALAISYTNESYQNLACGALKDWIAHHPQYKHLTGEKNSHLTEESGAFASQNVLNEVKSLYLEAANMDNGQIDPHVQCGLGVLLNLTGDYTKAIDCFRAALSRNPDDAKTWNKLGATLANSQRSDEAIEAYFKALEIEPGFIRCRYNLGISCINLEAYEQAVEHFLTALNTQEKASINGMKSSLPVSDTIWSTLRICLSRLGKYELHKAALERDLESLNKEFQIGN